MKKKINDNKEKGPLSYSFSSEDWEEFERGITYFNSGQYQHAYEAWELIWEHSAKIERKFLRGLMEITTSCQKVLNRNDFEGAQDSIEKAKEKLNDTDFLPEYLSVPVQPLIEFLDYSAKVFDQERINGSVEIWRSHIPKIYFHKPSNPDLLVELCEITRSDLFRDGVKYFNKGYFWESHEVWEELWREQIGDGKRFTEGFVQLAEAYHFVKVGKFSPAVYLLEKSLAGLRGFERIECLISITSSLNDAAELLQAIRFLPAQQNTPFKFSKKPQIEIMN
jgi:predicted metal-dependent hydrolase